MAKRRIGAVVMLLFAIVFAVVFIRTNATAGAYDEAPACAAGVIDTSGCRWTVDAPVVGVRKTRAARSTSAYLTVDLPSLGPTEVLLASSVSGVYDRAAAASGRTLRATGWHRDVVSLADEADEVESAGAPRGNAHLSFTLGMCALLVAVLLALPANFLARRIAGGFALVGLVALIMTGVTPNSPLLFDYGVAALAIGTISLLVLAIMALTRQRHAR